MGKVYMKPGGGGTASSDVTASKADVLEGKKTVTSDSGDEIAEGTMPNNGAVNHELPANGSYTIPKGYHNGAGEVTQDIPTQAAKTITPSTSKQTVLVNGKLMTGDIVVNPIPNIRGQSQMAGGWGSGGSGADAYFAMNDIPEGYYQKNGADWAPEIRMKQSDVRAAIGATDSSKWRKDVTIAGLKGTMTEQGGSTITPGTQQKTAVSGGRYVTEDIIVAGDPDLVAANIVSGKNIFGVAGSAPNVVASSKILIDGSVPISTYDNIAVMDNKMEIPHDFGNFKYIVADLYVTTKYNVAQYSSRVAIERSALGFVIPILVPTRDNFEYLIQYYKVAALVIGADNTTGSSSKLYANLCYRDGGGYLDGHDIRLRAMYVIY